MRRTPLPAVLRGQAHLLVSSFPLWVPRDHPPQHSQEPGPKCCLPFSDDLVGPQLPPDPDPETIRGPGRWIEEALGRRGPEP